MYSIGALAKKAACTVPTIRYYETIGLMPEAQRRSGGHRCYERRDLARLLFIRRCRDLDVPLERIRELLVIEAGGKPCLDTLAFFKSQRAAIQARIQALKDLDLSLSLYISGCETHCLPTAQPCHIFDELGQS
jgi:MerR family copper efflux transcriptional regulator